VSCPLSASAGALGQVRKEKAARVVAYAEADRTMRDELQALVLQRDAVLKAKLDAKAETRRLEELQRLQRDKARHSHTWPRTAILSLTPPSTPTPHTPHPPDRLCENG
jgi:hypothetical protein